MKIPLEHIHLLETEVKKLVNYDKKNTLFVRQNVGFADSQFISFCWKVFWTVKKEIRDTIWQGGIGDNHITTALKKILIDYKDYETISNGGK